jgi:threonine aldolase
MADAEVGDDVYGEDPTLNRLQEYAADRLGFEAALWLPSGTMGNLVAVNLLTEPTQEILVEERSHVVRYELSGMAVLSGVTPRVVRAEGGRLTAEHVRAAVGAKAYYKSDLGLVVLENTHNLGGGSVQTVEETQAVVAACREAGLNIHLDGARLWNAAVALGVPPRALAAGVDTVMVALSKGLCAPAGALLLSTRARIDRARRIRKLVGGGLRQAGILGAAGLVALERMIPRLQEDHDNAALLAEALASSPGVRVAPVRTNIVVATLERRSAVDVAGALKAEGILGAAMDATTLRLVTHHDVSREDCTRTAAVLRRILV